MTIPEVHDQMAPLHKLLLHRSANVICQEEMDERDAYFTVVCVFFPHTHRELYYQKMRWKCFLVELLCAQCQINWQKSWYLQLLRSGVAHRYVFPGVAWEAPAQRWILLDSVPFTHPAQIPAILEVLRHQCAINTLLMTCITSQHAAAGRLTILFNIFAELQVNLRLFIT